MVCCLRVVLRVGVALAWFDLFGCWFVVVVLGFVGLLVGGLDCVCC